MNSIRLLLADDHPMMRDAIRTLLAGSDEFEIVGEAVNGVECLAMVKELQPDILILDVAMPVMNGEQVASELQRNKSPVKIIAFSAYDQGPFIRSMIQAGARGYVVKGASGGELVTAMRAIARDKSYLSPEVAGSLMRQWQDITPRDRPRADRHLTSREKQILILIAQGRRTAAIALQLVISATTVEAHRRNLMRKLDLHSVADLTRYALRHELITL